MTSIDLMQLSTAINETAAQLPPKPKYYEVRYPKFCFNYLLVYFLIIESEWKNEMRNNPLVGRGGHFRHSVPREKTNENIHKNYRRISSRLCKRDSLILWHRSETENCNFNNNLL